MLWETRLFCGFLWEKRDLDFKKFIFTPTRHRCIDGNLTVPDIYSVESEPIRSAGKFDSGAADRPCQLGRSRHHRYPCIITSRLLPNALPVLCSTSWLLAYDSSECNPSHPSNAGISHLLLASFRPTSFPALSRLLISAV